MPLNVNNKQFVTSNDEAKPQQVFQVPPGKYPVFKYFLLGLFIVTVVSSAVFLVYIFALKQQVANQPAHEVVVAPPADTNIAQAVPPQTEPPQPQTERPPARTETPAAQPVPNKMLSGTYTVYIGSYTIEPPAKEEVSRWNEAGFSSAVISANNHYRVSLGSYATLEDARIFAEQMWEAFEYGYWIGKIE